MGGVAVVNAHSTAGAIANLNEHHDKYQASKDYNPTHDPLEVKHIERVQSRQRIVYYYDGDY